MNSKKDTDYHHGMRLLCILPKLSRMSGRKSRLSDIACTLGGGVSSDSRMAGFLEDFLLRDITDGHDWFNHQASRQSGEYFVS